MVIIISNEADIDLDQIMKWFNYKDTEVIRLNELRPDDFTIYFVNNEVIIKYDNITIKSVWIRKYPKVLFKSKIHIANDIQNYIDSEVRGFVYALFSSFGYLRRSLSTNVLINLLDTCKLDILIKASRLGIKIPNTLISSSQLEINSFIKMNGRCITKPISEGVFITDSTNTYAMYTQEIVDSNDYCQNLIPILVQEFIEKDYEIRSFYLNNMFYSSAYYNSSKYSKIDIRQITSNSPIRIVPYKLPENIEDKLRILCNELSLHCCSIDILYSKSNNEYTFLEINPFGIYNEMSLQCNYNLDLKIVNYLIT